MKAEWIKIEDKTPLNGSNVIAVGTWYGEINGQREDGYMGIGKWRETYVAIESDTYSTDIINVTHWMPLPEHP